MKRRGITLQAALAVIGMAALILDANTAAKGARMGIDICIQTVIPALFPFFLLSSVICSSFIGKSIGFMRPIGKLCGIPKGAESLLLLGFLGGYPVGAQSINESYINGYLDKESAARMLGFCSNAGPSFIFGMTAQLFENPVIPWLIWFIQITSSLLVGIILPKKPLNSATVPARKPITFVQALERSLKVTVSVCGWVIIFRVLTTLLSHWFLSAVPELLQVTIIGMLELTNGCISLHTMQFEPIRFLLCTVMLSCGGLCVGMQTAAVTKDVGLGMYFPGKALQTFVSLCLSFIVAYFLFNGVSQLISLLIFMFLCLLILVLCYKISSRNILKADV